MSCCGGKCGCGSTCNCGSGCGGCNMYPELGVEGSTTTKTMIIGVVPQKGHFEGMAAGSENGGCNCKCGCGPSCNCDSCSCCK